MKFLKANMVIAIILIAAAVAMIFRGIPYYGWLIFAGIVCMGGSSISIGEEDENDAGP